MPKDENTNIMMYLIAFFILSFLVGYFLKDSLKPHFTMGYDDASIQTFENEVDFEKIEEELKKKAKNNPQTGAAVNPQQVEGGSCGN
ncbi:MAG: hypothetical protein GF335_02110 [Candidatus Moranbacteria bacterium]|nr:hypothetical protein [Candidatus Moranbacteria bacterium]